MKLIGNILNNKKKLKEMRYVIAILFFFASCGTATTTDVTTDVVTDTVVAVDTVTVDTVVETVTDTVVGE